MVPNEKDPKEPHEVHEFPAINIEGERRGRDPKGGREGGSDGKNDGKGDGKGGKTATVSRDNGKSTISQAEASALMDLIKDVSVIVAVANAVTLTIGGKVVEDAMKAKLDAALLERERKALKEGRNADAKFIETLRKDIKNNSKIIYKFPASKPGATKKPSPAKTPSAKKPAAGKKTAGGKKPTTGNDRGRNDGGIH